MLLEMSRCSVVPKQIIPKDEDTPPLLSVGDFTGLTEIVYRVFADPEQLGGFFNGQHEGEIGQRFVHKHIPS